MTKTKGKRGRKRKAYNKAKLSIYRISNDIFELRISFKDMVYSEKLYYDLNELRAFIEIALPNQDSNRIVRALTKSRYFVHEYKW